MLGVAKKKETKEGGVVWQIHVWYDCHKKVKGGEELSSNQNAPQVIELERGEFYQIFPILSLLQNTKI